ncbi:MAG: hypothetical protein LQ346_001105 [Caloplaca aetnensis]|nr:MAG: hypothetical protein LQ346_001105 [Caloplaca aetnensis]
MRRRIDKQFGPRSTDNSSYNPAKESQDTLITPLKPRNEDAELEQVNVLYSFLENRYSKKMLKSSQYPLSDRLMKPLSDPEHYEKIVKELEEAPKRSWFGRLVNRWKGMIRWS